VPRISRDEAGANVAAVLDAFAWSEIGPTLLAITDDGYNCLVGATPSHPLTFGDYSHHPRILNRAVSSTAAGRYQFLYGTWFALSQKLHLPDFSPLSQDYGCIELIHECDAIADAAAGYFERVVQKCAHVWASLPEAGYGQHEQRMADLIESYKRAGGEYFAS